MVKNNKSGWCFNYDMSLHRDKFGKSFWEVKCKFDTTDVTYCKNIHVEYFLNFRFDAQ